MADMPNDFWSGWIIVLSSVGFFGLLWLVYDMFFGARMEGGEAHAVWDGDLAEGDSPAPMWWFWLILAAMVFSVVYLMLYPGLGSFAGALGWSQPAELHDHQARTEAQLATERDYLMNASLATLAGDSVAMASAARLFRDNCSACHGVEARGQLNSYPDLRDDDWLWGGSPEQIEQTIRNGRLAVMVSWQAPLGDSGVNDVAAYVARMGEPGAEEMPGRAVYMQFCFACHGADGGGNPLLGAPRLNDDIWLYGGSEDAIHASIADGRNGQMPAFGERLDDTEIKLLVAWLLR